MADSTEFETPIFPDKNYFVVPRSFYRRWRESLPRVVELRDNRGMGLICSVEPAPGEKAHFHTNIKAIVKAYRITEPTILNIKKVGENSFVFCLPMVNPGEARRRDGPGMQTFTAEPFWVSIMSRAKASGKQALNVPAAVVHSILNDRREHIDVLLPDNRVETWRLIWNKANSTMCHIGHGWYSFVQEYHVRAGQVVRFSKSDDGSIIRVTVNDD